MKKRLIGLSKAGFARLSGKERREYIRRQGAAIREANTRFRALVELNKILLENARKPRRRDRS